MSGGPDPAAREAPARVTASTEATERLGEAFAPALRAGDVVALSGPLGAGKTRLVAGLARGLDPRSRVRSPSFTLVNEYRGPLSLFHLDLYRIEAMDADALGLEEYAERGALIVEWGEKLPWVFLREALCVAIEPGAGDTRTLRASARGGRGLELLTAWETLAP
jgi:tRNA threonylcarbamoyladenosine biosynthesis protein TsaE